MCITFASEVGLAAYLPPIVNRQLKWRDGPAGSDITEAEWNQFCKSGFKAKHRVEVVDCIRGLGHTLSTGIRKSLLDFRLPSILPSLSGGSLRYWQDSRWMRVNCADLQNMMTAASASGSLTEAGPSASGSRFLGEQELPDTAKDPPMLLLTVDQKQSQWTAAKFMADPNGMGLMVMFRGDKFHRSWRDFAFAMKHAAGYLDHTAVQLHHAFNVNYAPF